MVEGPAAPPLWIDRQADLSAFCQRIEASERIGFDTEFHGERSYFPHLMLIQVALPDCVALIDARADLDLRGFFGRMRDSGALIVGHALHNDLEIVASVYGVHFERLFDTQIAAAFCGYGLQIGLAPLLQGTLSLRLPKGAQLAEWSRRPLPEKQLAYAANDVLHLEALYQRLSRRLRDLDRVEWVETECRALCSPDRYGRDPAEAWQRIGPARKLPPRDLGVLVALASERDAIAREVDTVPHFLVSDDVLLTMARHAPTDRDALIGDRRMGNRNLARYADRWLDAIRRGLATPVPLPPGRPPPEPGVEAVAGLLILLVNEIAAREGVASQLLLKRRQVVEALQDGCKCDNGLLDRLGLHGWRLELVGAQVRSLLDGQTQAAVRCADDGSLGLSFVRR